MKYYLSLFFLYAGFFLKGEVGDDKLIIKGELKGQENDKVSISFTGPDGKHQSYMAEAKNGRFAFEINKPSQPVVARLNSPRNKSLSRTINGQTVSNPSPALEFFLCSSYVEIKGSVDELHLAKVKGGRENDEYARLRKQTYPSEKRRWEISRLTFNMDREKDSAAYNKLVAESLTLSRKQWELQKKFINENPTSFGSLFLLSRMENLYTAEDYETAFNSLSDDYKITSIAQKIAKRIEFLSPTGVGKPSVNFVRKDMDGNEVNLSNYKGRIVLLDFWGSWCGPCRASHPHLKELYRQYRDKGFEIIAIASENAKTPAEQKQKWLAAIEKDGIGWVHILNNDGKESQDIVKDYRVTAFPTKILLDKEGKILLRVTASATDDLDKTLQKLFTN